MSDNKKTTKSPKTSPRDEAMRLERESEFELHMNPDGNGTRRKTTNGAAALVSADGVCECGWEKDINCAQKMFVIAVNDWCNTCNGRYWSVCNGNGHHTCPNCGNGTI
jgi:hypothetical protein